MSNIFDMQYARYDRWYENNRYAYLSELEALKRVVPDKGKGLEIGVGTGRFASFLGIQYGIDPSEKMLKLARERGINAVKCGGEKLPYRKYSFDFVVIVITLCFVNDPLKILAEARRILKKNGRIIIGIIDKDSFLGKYYQKKKSVFYKKANFYGVKEVTDFLRATGFLKKSIARQYINCPKKFIILTQ